MKKKNRNKLIKKKVAIIVPAHNEEKVLSATLESALTQIDASDLYVVDDGSRDDTVAIAKKYTENVLILLPNKGKAGAINSGIVQFNLVENYDYIMPMDADTEFGITTISKMVEVFKKESQNNVVCVISRVVGRGHNWLTTFRIWEYEIGQRIHKFAQSKVNSITVSPGCATMYSSQLLKQVLIPLGTMTEDMDLTFEIHRKKLGTIAFCQEAEVITQDPKYLNDLIKQLDRWYTGFWQCLVKHNIPWEGQMIDFEVALQAVEGLFFGLLTVLLLILLPTILILNPWFILTPLIIDLLFFTLPTILYTMIRYRIWKIVIYIPFYYGIRMISSIIFLKSFFNVVLGVDFKMGWNKVLRYQIDEVYPRVSVLDYPFHYLKQRLVFPTLITFVLGKNLFFEQLVGGYN